jgi:phage shock protein C
MDKRLYRSRNEKMIAGICGGIAEYFDVDPTLVRVGTVIVGLLTAIFPLLLGYFICTIIIPEQPY